jgi:asparagine synthase (glutamine-hydrolysing)
MCGIAGIAFQGSPQPYQKAIRNMTEALIHRGPDASGFYNSENLVLGHRRLKIIDLDNRSNQPMSLPGGRHVLAFNGEIYNYRELQARFQFSNPLGSTGDTEVLLQLLSLQNKLALESLNGMFAFAYWNAEKQELLLARDRMGIKPLYFCKLETGELLFASEIRSLLASGLLRARTAPKLIAEYLAYQTIHAPNTILEGVHMLEAGHYLIWKDGELSIKSWWQPEHHFKSFGNSSREKAHRNIRSLLRDAVARRLVADVPFGAFLSGGIDSSAIVGLMREITSDTIHTFNVGFDEGEYSEAAFARKVAEKFKTDHTEILLRPADFLNLVPQALKAMDHPGGDGPNTYVISKAVKEKGITMALSGLGGDELFAGYAFFKRYQWLQDNKWLHSFPFEIRGLAGRLLALLKPGIAAQKTAEVLRQPWFTPPYIYPINRRVLSGKQIHKLIDYRGPDVLEQLLAERFEFGKAANSLPELSKVSLCELTTYMRYVLLRDTDQMSMAHALEVRVPFLDHQLVEYVLGIPDPLKYPATPKQLLVESLGDLLPPEIVNRPKMGFVLPWENWLRADLKPIAAEGISRFAALEGINSGEVEQLWQRFLKGDKNLSWSRIWPLVVLGNWMEMHHE